MAEYLECEFCKAKIFDLNRPECTCGAKLDGIFPKNEESAAYLQGGLMVVVQETTTSAEAGADSGQPCRATTIFQKIKLVSRRDGFEIPVPMQGCVLGREGELFPEYFENGTTFVSRRHATLLLKEDGFYIIDNNSHNGTTINKRLLTGGKEYKLNTGDLVALGDVEFVVQMMQ